MSWEKQFIIDYRSLDQKLFESRYTHQVPQGVTIKAILEVAKKENLVQNFIDPKWYGDTRDKNTYYLIKNENGNFEVFLSEIGGKHWLKIYDNQDDAVIDKIDLILNSLKFITSDSKLK